LAESFYDPKFHGVDWKAVRDKYRPLVQHVALREDFYNLVNLMLGELNASHLGISGTAPPQDEVTADLGLLFDESYPGPGLKILEIWNRAPADKRGIVLKPGEIVLAIDGEPVSEKTNLGRLLNGKTGELIPLTVTPTPADKKAERRVD